VNGELQIIEIDDFFPCKKVNSNEFKSAFSKPRNNSLLWVLILEKSWAKLNGSYDLTDGGYTDEAISCLTGAP
jgi:calpain-15